MISSFLSTMIEQYAREMGKCGSYGGNLILLSDKGDIRDIFPEQVNGGYIKDGEEIVASILPKYKSDLNLFD